MMNSTSYKAFFFGIASALAISAAFTHQTETAQAPKQGEIVKLERVIIEGKRLKTNEQVAQLPRVVIEGRSLNHGVQLASVQAVCDAQTLC
ncbi:hypothetical protein [Paucibacter soli]|uniref:hypothetical protein n=1 Tax=Paucibacter soli TaxID=3133433 RepID=UPI0030B21D66